jgi:hypothetical protein
VIVKVLKEEKLFQNREMLVESTNAAHSSIAAKVKCLEKLMSRDVLITANSRETKYLIE